MADAEKNPKRRAQGQLRGRGEMGRRSTGAQASAEGATGQWDARRIVGTADSVGQKEKQTGSSIGMWYSDGAERKVVAGKSGRRRRGAALCPSGAARCQGSDLQERQTDRGIQYSDKLVPGSWLMVRSERLLGWAGGSAGLLESGAMEPRLGGTPVDWQLECACYPPTWYMAAKLSARQDGAALKTLDLRAACSEGLTTPGLGGHRRHGTPARCNGVRTFVYAAGLHSANAATGFQQASP